MQDNFILAHHHAHIITGGTVELRRTRIATEIQNLTVPSYDCITIFPLERSIGIEQVRQFRKDLAVSGHTTAGKVGILMDAQLLTVEAQNALLKTLEEPPPNTRLILETSSIDILLPTVLSRSRVTTLFSQPISLEDSHEWLSRWSDLQKLSIGRQMASIENIAIGRQEVAQWVQNGIEALERELHRQSALSSQEATRGLRALIQANRKLAANVAPKMTLDLVVLNLKNSG